MENFFQVCLYFNDEIEIQELLLRRYNNIEFILQMEVLDFLLFLQKAREKELEEKRFQTWCALYPYMDKDNYISFDDYCIQLDGKHIDTRSNEEILAEVEEIEKRLGV